MPKLLVKNGDKKGYVVRLSRTSGRDVTIGRYPSNLLVLPDQRISRYHARIYVQDNDFYLEDLGSVNGTMVNGQPVREVPLNIGDEIVMGSTRMAVLSITAPEQLESGSSSTLLKISDEESLPRGMTVEVAVSSSDSVPVLQKFDELAEPDVEQAYQRLMILYRISSELSSVVSLPVMLEKIVRFVLTVIEADQGLIMLKDEESGEPVLQVVQGKDGAPPPSEILFSSTIADQVMQKGESVLTTDAARDERFKAAESIIHQGIRSSMCVPIKAGEKILGLMQVDTRGQVVRFTRDDLELLTAICHQIGVAIEKARLFEDLHRANRELKEQQDQLIEAEKLGALGRLAGGVAHEINNPLTSILGFAEICLKQIEKGLTPAEEAGEQKEFLNIIINESHHCQRIAQSLLQFSRKKKAETGPVDVAKVVETALTIARFHIKASPVKIVKDLPERALMVNGDSGQLQQVFLNMIINAKDAMEDGGTLTIAAAEIDNWTEIRFADTGCGIPEDKIKEIFQPLYTSKAEGKGTGLGLSISQDIVERHQGQIEVESVLGEGTAFRIRIPSLKPQEGGEAA